MAALNRPNADRGQLMLVTGLTIALVLVALIVLLNTVIYTENLATRGVDAGGADAIEYRATVVGSVGELIEVENERFDEGYPPTTAVATGTGTIADALAERHLARGAVAESELKGGADGITTRPPIVWQAEVENGEVVAVEERIEVSVAGDGGSPYEYDDAPLEIDLVDGTIDAEGRETVSVEPPASVDVIRYENGDRATGTFELRSDGTPDEDDLIEYAGTDGAAPYYTYLVESVDLAIHYETAELRYTTETTVTAGESA